MVTILTLVITLFVVHKIPPNTAMWYGSRNRIFDIISFKLVRQARMPLGF